jgi:hypothetical protein
MSFKHTTYKIDFKLCKRKNTTLGGKQRKDQLNNIKNNIFLILCEWIFVIAFLLIIISIFFLCINVEGTTIFFNLSGRPYKSLYFDQEIMDFLYTAKFQALPFLTTLYMLLKLHDRRDTIESQLTVLLVTIFWLMVLLLCYNFTLKGSIESYPFFDDINLLFDCVIILWLCSSFKKRFQPSLIICSFFSVAFNLVTDIDVFVTIYIFSILFILLISFIYFSPWSEM